MVSHVNSEDAWPMKKLDPRSANKRTVHVSMARDIYERVAKLASDGNRPISRQIEMLLEKGIIAGVQDG